MVNEERMDIIAFSWDSIMLCIVNLLLYGTSKSHYINTLMGTFIVSRQRHSSWRHCKVTTKLCTWHNIRLSEETSFQSVL